MADRRSDYMEDLAKDARIRQYARMLPMGKLPDEKHEEVRRAYIAFTYKYNLTDSEVAKKIGYGASTLSQWKNGKYGAKGDEITRSVNDFMEREGRKYDARVELPFITTRVANGMIGIARIAYEEQCMAAIVAPAGSGKTKVMQVLKEKMRGFYLYCDEDFRPKTFMQALAEAVGADGSHGTISELKEQIIDRIAGSGRPIFLDEVHRLPTGILSRVRTIHDRSGCPIIMAGTHEILDRIDDRSNNRGQMHSRCITWNATERMYDAEGKGGPGSAGSTLFSKKEIAELFEAMPVRLDRGGMEMIWALACLPAYGTLRLVRRILNLVHRRSKGRPVGRDEIVEVLETFFGVKAEHVHNLAKKTIQDHRRAA